MIGPLRDTPDPQGRGRVQALPCDVREAGWANPSGIPWRSVGLAGKHYGTGSTMPRKVARVRPGRKPVHHDARRPHDPVPGSGRQGERHGPRELGDGEDREQVQVRSRRYVHDQGRKQHRAGQAKR